MQPLNVSNHLLDNQDALNAAWERDGYWFFRDVLDRESVGRLRGIYMDMLAEYGVAERDDPEALYTGASLEGFPFRMCWIPLAQIDENVGGVILGEGMHRGPLLHDLNNPPLFQVPEGAVPESAWRRAVYQP